MNTVQNWDTVAKVRDPHRAALWREAFGREEVPVVSLVPENVSLPGKPNALAYRLDLKAITAEQRQKLIEVTAREFDLPEEEVARDIDNGVPILADDVTVISFDQNLLFSLLPDWSQEELEAWDYD